MWRRHRAHQRLVRWNEGSASGKLGLPPLPLAGEGWGGATGKAPSTWDARFLSLQPRSDVSNFGQSIKRPNSGKPEFDCRLGRARCGAIFARTAWALTFALACGCGADAQLLDCLGGQKPTQVAELMFGRNIGSRLGVKEAEWGRFVDREIISRFPNGLTVLNAGGQWRDEATKKIVREPSKLVQIVLPGQVEDIARLNEIVAAYKRRFKQQSVVMIVRPACVSF